MRRTCCLVALSFFVFATIAWARPVGIPWSALNHAGMGQSYNASTQRAEMMLLGSKLIHRTRDQSATGWASAFRFGAKASGTTRSISVYVPSRSTAKTLVAGLYGARNGQPGRLMASGSSSLPKSGRWVSVPISSADVQAGRDYWIAVLGKGGMLYFLDQAAGSCQGVRSQNRVATLPGLWRSGSRMSKCGISAYVAGAPAASGLAGGSSGSGAGSGTSGTLGGVSAPSAPTLLTLPPVNTSPPTISGTPQQGQTLTASTGSWLDDPTAYAYQWQDCGTLTCSDISGATGSSYMLQASDVGSTIDVVVTASNAGGALPATSSRTGTVQSLPAPTDSSLPTITGTAQQGQTLTASHGAWTGSPTSYAYQWQDCSSSCSNISGATGTTYALQSSDVGDTIDVVVTATNAGGSGKATSAKTATVTAAAPAAPTNSSLPTITGTAQQGQTLTASHGAWTGSPTSYGYQWQDCTSSSCSNISGATGTTYALQSSDVGDTIDVVVTATNAGGSGQATSAKTATVTATPPAAPTNTSLPTITGTAQQGQTLTASHGAWTGSPTSYGYQWQDCSSSCSNISGATGTTYAVQSSDVGDTIDVVVTATNAGGSGQATSAKTATVTASSPPPPPTGLHVSGNKLLDANGNTVVLRGVDRAGTEYMCAQGNGITDGPSGSSEFAPMASWKINSVFIGLNEDCWLGINGVKSQYGGQNYINAIKAEVSAAEAAGIYPVIGFFWGDPGTELANSSDDPNGGGQPALPDNDHAPLFWEEVADTFKSDPNVIFRLQEEPHPAGNSSGSSAWTCWSQGDVQYSPSSVNAYGTAPTPTSSVSHCNEKSTNNSISYSTVGMQSLTNIIRGTGATNVVQVPGVQYANMMACTTSGSPTSCGFLQPGVRVTDTFSSVRS